MKADQENNLKRFLYAFDSVAGGYTKISFKLPEDTGTITGIFVSIKHTIKTLKGVISIRFGDGASGPLLFHLVRNTALKRTTKRTVPLSEAIEGNLSVTGFYKDSSGISYEEYQIVLYIDYEVKEKP